MAKKKKNAVVDDRVYLVLVQHSLERILDNDDEICGDTREDLNDLVNMIHSHINRDK